MAQVYLGLGSNLGDRERYILRALEVMTREGLRVRAVSPLYETEPWGITHQPRFLNGACLIETDLAPHALLRLLHRIEDELGRVRTIRNGPRTIDLDILLYDDLCLDTPELKTPHPGMLTRSTVLVPLADIAPDVRHPATGRTIAEHRAALGPAPDVAPYPPGLPPRVQDTDPIEVQDDGITD